jgi:DNA-binding transcriptional regulator WhiA
MAAKVNLAYIIGVAMGDGNLSRPNKRATRLRITCDAAYPGIENDICIALNLLFPKNKVSKVNGPRDTYFNISVYSNALDIYMPWKVGKGSKFKQNVRVPGWIFRDNMYISACLRGLIQTDGSVYSDRGYKMVNFTNNILDLATDVKSMMEILGYQPKIYSASQKSSRPKYTVRLSRDVNRFIAEISLKKENEQIC